MFPSLRRQGPRLAAVRRGLETITAARQASDEIIADDPCAGVTRPARVLDHGALHRIRVPAHHSRPAGTRRSFSGFASGRRDPMPTARTNACVGILEGRTRR
jgi:hypothetical protein